jgi:DNA-directed RNA polymerase subunit E'/Rpb7
MLAGVRELLLLRLHKYNAALKGVPMAISKIAMCDSRGLVPSDFPAINCSAAVTYTVFAPTVGKSVVGVVNNTSADHIGLLILNTFNASVSAEQLPKTYIYDESAGEWQDSATNTTITTGSSLNVEVLAVDVTDDVIQIHASMTGSVAGYDALVVSIKCAHFF